MNRKELTQQIKNWLETNNLDDIYGCLVGEIKPNNNPKAVIAYTVSFCQSKLTDGQVIVYSTSKIVIDFQTCIRALPHKAKIEVKNFEDFVEYMKQFKG